MSILSSRWYKNLKLLCKIILPHHGLKPLKVGTINCFSTMWIMSECCLNARYTKSPFTPNGHCAYSCLFTRNVNFDLGTLLPISKQLTSIVPRYLASLKYVRRDLLKKFIDTRPTLTHSKGNKLLWPFHFFWTSFLMGWMRYGKVKKY